LLLTSCTLYKISMPNNLKPYEPQADCRSPETKKERHIDEPDSPDRSGQRLSWRLVHFDSALFSWFRSFCWPEDFEF
jgi:hypothetical protein